MMSSLFQSHREQQALGDSSRSNSISTAAGSRKRSRSPRPRDELEGEEIKRRRCEQKPPKNAATEFTPFQLLFGRDVKGPLGLLKDQLTGDTPGSTPVVEYMDSLKKLHLAREMAAGHDTTNLFLAG